MYCYKKQIALSYHETIDKVKDNLKKEGFGVLTEIDVKETIKKKLDIDFDRYLILGVCNPSLAFGALQAERDIGVFLPCNVVIYEHKSKTFVSVILPKEQLKIIGNPQLEEIGAKVEHKLKKAVNITCS